MTASGTAVVRSGRQRTAQVAALSVLPMPVGAACSGWVQLLLVIGLAVASGCAGGGDTSTKLRDSRLGEVEIASFSEVDSYPEGCDPLDPACEQPLFESRLLTARVGVPEGKARDATDRLLDLTEEIEVTTDNGLHPTVQFGSEGPGDDLEFVMILHIDQRVRTFEILWPGNDPVEFDVPT